MRAMPKPDDRVEAAPLRATWVLVQTLPFVKVLASADNKARLHREASDLMRQYDEAKEARTFAAVIERTDHLSG